MTSQETSATSSSGDARSHAKAAVRGIWGLGDYHRFAQETVWELGPELVRACGIARGQRVLDVAAGSGNVALRAAEAGADVVAADLTPENLEAGRGAAAELGVELEWVEADVEELPSRTARSTSSPRPSARCSPLITRRRLASWSAFAGPAA